MAQILDSVPLRREILDAAERVITTLLEPETRAPSQSTTAESVAKAVSHVDWLSSARTFVAAALLLYALTYAVRAVRGRSNDARRRAP